VPPYFWTIRAITDFPLEPPIIFDPLKLLCC